MVNGSFFSAINTKKQLGLIRKVSFVIRKVNSVMMEVQTNMFADQTNMLVAQTNMFVAQKEISVYQKEISVAIAKPIIGIRNTINLDLLNYRKTFSCINRQFLQLILKKEMVNWN